MLDLTYNQLWALYCAVDSFNQSVDGSTILNDLLDLIYNEICKKEAKCKLRLQSIIKEKMSRATM
ncbi:MAG: hypothetical protein ACTSRC_20470 [Candidatus Helarchaeota archaeon]